MKRECASDQDDGEEMADVIYCKRSRVLSPPFSSKRPREEFEITEQNKDEYKEEEDCMQQSQQQCKRQHKEEKICSTDDQSMASQSQQEATAKEENEECAVFFRNLKHLSSYLPNPND